MNLLRQVRIDMYSWLGNMTTVTVGSTFSTNGCGPILDTARLVQTDFCHPQPAANTCKSPNFIQNGDFETAFCAGSSCFLSNDSTIAPWFRSGPPGCPPEVNRVAAWPAYSGNYSMYLTGSCPSTINQLVQLTAGKSYTLSLRLNRNPSCKDEGWDKTGFISVTGGEATNFSFALYDQPWKRVTYTFTAANGKFFIFTLNPSR